MKDAFSHLSSLIIWVLTIFSLSVIIISGMEIYNAHNFHSQVIHRIEASHYSNEVINECMVLAQENGYTLTVEDMTVYDDRKDVKVSLTYTIIVPLFDLNNTETLIGYAR